MSSSKKPRKSKLPKDIADLPDTEVAKHLFGKRAAKALEKIVNPPETNPRPTVKRQSK
jgi:hypothetical protein